MPQDRVTQIDVYYPEDAQPFTDLPDPSQYPEIPLVFHAGPDPAQRQKHLGIESVETRLKLNEDEANLCISVMPGLNHLGELSINVQFEGAKRAEERKQQELRNLCMSGQNDLAVQMGEWLNELFEDAPEPWTFKIAAEPCPHTDEEPFRILKIIQAIEVGAQSETSVTGQTPRIVEIIQEVERNRSLETGPAHDPGVRRNVDHDV